MNPLRPTPKLSDLPRLLRSSPAMFRDLIQRRYRKVPAGTLTGVVLGLIYLINPLDLIPDVLPIFGVVDDSLVVGIVLALLSCDVKKYLSWKNSNPRPNNTRDLTPPANH